MIYTVKELAEITGSKLHGDGEISIKKIAFDSRIIYSATDTAFLAINTPKNSGEKYIESAREKGIKVIIAEKIVSDFSDLTWILCDNTTHFLQKLAKYHREKHPHLQRIGITGSNGKTVVKEWLYQSLWDYKKTVKSPKSYNSQIGLPLSLLEIESRDEIGLFEVGISKPGEMQVLEEILHPEIGIFTHMGSAHLSNFKGEKELIEEKLKLFKQANVVIYNADHPLVREKMESLNLEKTLISFGFSEQNDFRIVGDWRNLKEPIALSYQGKTAHFPAQQRDNATLSNVLCLFATLNCLGFSEEQIIEKINALRSVEMRLESVNGQRDNLIINDSFNLDLDSLITAYQFINEYKKPARSLVLTDFVEGNNLESLYPLVARLTNEQNFRSVFLVGKEISGFSHLFKGDVFTFRSTDELIESPLLLKVENELILLKGARKFEIERIKNLLELQKHDTTLEVNLNAILHNINVHKSLLKPETKMMAMVKAYAYGLGGYEIAEFLQHHHIDYLGVAYADEGMDLRKKGITTPIMVMNPEQHSYATLIEYNLEPEIYSLRVLELFVKELELSGRHPEYPIHIKLETGMHRLGFKSTEIPELIEALRSLPVKVQSVFSHLSTSDVPEEKAYVHSQAEAFNEMSEQLQVGLGYPFLRHLLNSSGITSFPEYQYDMTRIGIGMVGISSDEKVKESLQSAVRFITVISQISEIDKGDSVGYGRNFKADQPTRIATLPVGYADGIPRLIGRGVGHVSIRGHKVPIVGNVCMDMLMVDIGDLECKEGDPVILFNSSPSLEEFASYCQTIPYEVLTSISRRVKRIYIKN